jgi:transposase
LVVIDETSSCRGTKLVEKMGRSPIGERAIVWEWSINGIQFSVIAALCPLGFLCWRIFYGTIDHKCIEIFLEKDLAKCLDHNSIVLADNASVHKTDSTLESFRKVTRDQYIFIPRYCPRLSPIENAFSLVWSEVRRNEMQAAADSIGTVHRAFLKYSVSGTQGHVVNELFNVYFRNQQRFKDSFR